MARTLNGERAVGRPAADASRSAIGAGQSPFATISQEGVPVRAAHSAVPGTGWTVVVAVPTERIEAPLRRALLVAALINGGLLLTGLLAALLHARRIAAPLDALSAGAAALGRGAPPPPVPRGVREASAVARALSDASDDLARRGQERDQAERRRALLVRS